MTDGEDKELLARFAPRRRVDPGVGYEAVTDLWYALTDGEHTHSDWHGYTADHLDVTASHLGAALRLLPSVRSFLDIVESDILAAWMDRGATWSSLAEQLGYTSGDALRQRYRRLGGTRTWSAGRPAAAPESVLASREQVAQWRTETLDRLAAHPALVVAPEYGTPGYWALFTPQGTKLGEEMTDMLDALREQGVRLTRPDDSELSGELDWSRESARALPETEGDR